MPVVDALLVGGLCSQRITEHGFTVGLAGISALACGVLTATGGVRFKRRAAVWTTFLGAVVLAYLFSPATDPSGLLYCLCAIASLGLLNIWITDLVRRSMEGARGRLVLGRFLPQALVEDAFKGKLALLEAPRSTEATVLVSDLRGFTQLAESMDPAEVMTLLSTLQGRLAQVVQEHGGLVDKFMGDGMLAVFGVAGGPENHALHAVEAAAEIRRTVSALNAEGLVAKPLRVGIGVHTGPVVAGCLGSGDRLEFTVIGDTVNTTSRLESATKEKQVDLLISAQTASRVPAEKLVALGELQLRGRQTPVQVFGLALDEPVAAAG